MVWWIHGACLACLSSWWPARKTVASHPSQKPGLSSRPGQTTSFTRASPTITQPPQWKRIGNARRQTMGCARPSSQVACARRQAQVEYVQLAGCASRHRAMLELRPVRCADPHAVRLLWPLPVGWVRGHRPHRQHQAAVLPAKLPAVLCNVQFHEGFHRPPCLPPSRGSNRMWRTGATFE